MPARLECPQPEHTVCGEAARSSKTRATYAYPSDILEAPMILTDEPSRDDVQFLEDRIDEHNMVHTDRRDFRPLALFVRDDNGGILAGLCGFTWAGWLEIKFVWVSEGLRGRGHGRRLVEAAEAEARIRGCGRVWLDSYTFQAPTFYLHLGYEIFGLLPDYPAQHERVFLTRNL